MLLVHDANVLIDLAIGGLLTALFGGPWRIVTPNALFHRELAAAHPQLPDLGLELLDVESNWVARSIEWATAYRSTSAMDRLCLALARQEACPLVTGDARQRKAAETEGCEVFGTIWLVEQLVDNQLASTAHAFAAYEAMQAAGRRLPLQTARRRPTAMQWVRLATLSACVIVPLLAPLFGRLPSQKRLLIAVAVVVVSVAVAGLAAGPYALAAALAVMTAGVAACAPALVETIAQTSPAHQRGSATAMYGCMLFVGASFAGPTATAFQHLGYFYAAGGFVAVLVIGWLAAAAATR